MSDSYQAGLEPEQWEHIQDAMLYGFLRSRISSVTRYGEAGRKDGIIEELRVSMGRQVLELRNENVNQDYFCITD